MTRATLLALAVCGVSACRASTERAAGDFERMRQQQRYDVYERSGFFRNGAVMQAPPAHTIARPADSPWSGHVDSPAYLTGADASGDVAAPPFTVDQHTIDAGRDLFKVTCTVCHGAGGYGGGLMAANLTEKRPPSLRSPSVTALPAGTLFKVITNGLGRMPPYGWQLPVASRWAVVAYVRALASVPQTPETRADSTMAEYLRRIDSTHSLDARMIVRPPSSGGGKP